MKESLKEKIIGTWKLVSWTYENEHGETVHYLGKDATGILMYDRNGYMNAQLMRASRPKFASGSISGSTPEEAHAAFNSYLAYFGKYYEAEPGEIVHVVEGSLFPNWLGNNESRFGELHGNRLILHTPPIPAAGREIVFYITWERVGV